MKVGAVNHHMSAKFEYSGADPTAGGKVVGAGGGKVKTAGAGLGHNTVIAAVDTTAKTVEVTFR